MANLPSLPSIQGELIIDLYMHRSIQNDSVNDDYGTMDRLIQLGVKALDTALYTHFFRKRPILTAPQLDDEVAAAVSEAKLKDWLAAYGIQKQYRGSPNLLGSPEDMYRFFHGFVGALYYRNGMAHVHAWISELIDANVYNNGHEVTPPAPTNSPPPVPTNSPPPLPNPASPPRNVIGNVLSILNEAAARHGFSVTYPAEKVGPDHAPTWTVECTISGIVKGTGTGTSQKQAKEQAARQALESMGPAW